MRFDDERTSLLAEEGILVLRFWNGKILNHAEEALGVIWETIEERRAAASPSPP